jgi:hypothetical protein
LYWSPAGTKKFFAFRVSFSKNRCIEHDLRSMSLQFGHSSKKAQKQRKHINAHYIHMVIEKLAVTNG